jgi:hypothetical protein
MLQDFADQLPAKELSASNVRNTILSGRPTSVIRTEAESERSASDAAQSSG